MMDSRLKKKIFSDFFDVIYIASYIIPNISQLIKKTFFQKSCTGHQRIAVGFRINFSVTELKHSEAFIYKKESSIFRENFIEIRQVFQKI